MLCQSLLQSKVILVGPQNKTIADQMSDPVLVGDGQLLIKLEVVGLYFKAWKER